MHEGWCTRGVVQGVVCKAFARGASLARGVVHECCARLLHIGTPLAQAAVHKRALLHKQWCTSPLHKGPPLAQVWCGAQVCCTRGHLLHRDVARVCCTRAHLLHKGWCSRPLHDDPALALAHPVAQGSTPCSCITCASRCCTRALHKSSASSVVLHKPLHEAFARIPCSVARGLLHNRTIAQGALHKARCCTKPLQEASPLHEAFAQACILHRRVARGTL